MRGRSRKGPNPLARVLESNGPDVKIRGTASHIAEKYVTLARDAQASGDPVSAENYLQHAEHYFRMIAAAQAQLAPQQTYYREDNARDESDEDDGDDELYVNGAPVPGLGPQPIVAAPMYQREFRDPSPHRDPQQSHNAPQAHPNGNGNGNRGNGQPVAAPTNGFVHEAPSPAPTPAPPEAEAAAAPSFDPATPGSEPAADGVVRRRRRTRRRTDEPVEGAPAPVAPDGDTRATED